ncbi:MAG: aromatic ring-hydroxylating dioxygenase subunit alpha [Gammaproteobacteria bacterium]|nr:MAG: aromatic ring-hydroxylating dioxygenase subunit alpha [Gammaproteobacteria bacterium]
MHKLPVETYTSRTWFEKEQEMIFSRTWQFAGFVEDLSEPGQYLTVQAGLNNILVVVGNDRKLHAYHNICRHRGTQLLRAVGKTKKVITCPYHDWAYAVEDGRLLTVPNERREFPDLDKSCLGLKPASVGVWRGMIWVHPEPNAISLSEWFGPVESDLGPHQVEYLVEYPEAATTTDIHANWKIVVENYIDVYHLSHLHSGTLSMYDHAKAEYRFVGPHYVFWEPLARHYAVDVEKKAPLPLFDEIPSERLGAWVPMLFPNLGLAETECTWSTFHIIPLAPDMTRVQTRTKVKNASGWRFTTQWWRSGTFWAQRTSPKVKGDPVHDPLASGDFMAEDVYVCEQQQRSLRSPYFEVGPAAHYGESPIIAFQQTVLNWLKREQ